MTSSRRRVRAGIGPGNAKRVPVQYTSCRPNYCNSTQSPLDNEPEEREKRVVCLKLHRVAQNCTELRYPACRVTLNCVELRRVALNQRFDLLSGCERQSGRMRNPNWIAQSNWDCADWGVIRLTFGGGKCRNNILARGFGAARSKSTLSATMGPIEEVITA